MSSIGRASIEVGADTSGFESQVRSRIPASLSRVASQAQGAADRVARSWGNSLADIIPRVQDIGQTFVDIGPKISGVGDALTKGITVPAAGAVTAAAGITAAFGWGRLKSLDTAKGQLRGLGYETDEVQAITDQLSKDLEGGMMTLGQATSAAATAMAAGVEPGKELTRYIQTLDAAGVASSGSLDEMAQVFGRITDQGKLTRNEFDIISHRIPGFSSAVQEHMGVSSEAMYEMLRNGEITSNDFLDIMDNFAGGMATEYSKTWEGMVQNTKAWIGVIGEQFLGGVFEQSKETLAEFIEFLSSDEVIAWAAEIGDAIGQAFTQVIQFIQDAINWFMNLDSSTQKTIGMFAAFAVALGPILSIGGRVLTWVGKLITSPLGQTFTRWATSAAKIIGAQGLGGIGTIAQKVIGIFGRFARVGGILGVVVAAIVAVWNSSEGFRNAVAELGSTLWGVITDIGSKLGEVFAKIGELFGSIGGGDGPLGQIVSILIDTLAPAFTMIVEVITSAVSIIGDVITGLLDIFMGFMDIIIGLFTGDWSQVWDGVVQIFSGAWNIITGIFTGVWEMIKSVVVGIISTFGAFGQSVMEVLTGVWDAVTGWLDGVMQSFSDAVMNFFAMLGEWISTGWQAIVSFFQGVWVGFVAMWTVFWNSLVETVSAIWQGIQTVIQVVWTFITTAISTGLTFIQTLWTTVWTAISTVASTIWNAIVTFITTAINNVRNTISNVMNAIRTVISTVWNAIRSVVTSVLNGIRSTVTSIWNGIRSTISSVMNGIRSVITSIWNGIRSVITSVLNGIRSVVTSVWNGIRSAISSAMSSISSGLSSAWNAARNLVSNAVNAIKNAVTNGFNNVVSFIGSIPGRITSALGNLGSLLTGAGRSLIDGFLGGIKNAWGKVTGFVKDGLGKLRNLLPFSPAKEGPFSGRGYTLYSGQALIDDFAKGIQGQEQALTRSMRGVAASASDALNFAPNVPNIVPRTSGLMRTGSVAAPRTASNTASSSTVQPVMQVNGPLVSVENMTVDSDMRVKQVSQDLYTRAMRQARARGKVDLSGVVEK